MRLSTSFFIWGTSHSSMAQLDVGALLPVQQRRRQGHNASMCRRALSGKSTQPLQPQPEGGSAAEHTCICKSAPRRSTSTYGKACSIQRTNERTQNCQIHFHTSVCICLATTESLERARFLIKRRSLMKSPDLIWRRLHQQSYNTTIQLDAAASQDKS